MVQFGKFRLLNLQDLDWEREMSLVCPIDELGPITLWHASRHGGLDGSGAPAFLSAIHPQVILVNGPRKGMGQVDRTVKSTTPGGPKPYEKNSYLRMANLSGVEDIWRATCRCSIVTRRTIRRRIRSPIWKTWRIARGTGSRHRSRRMASSPSPTAATILARYTLLVSGFIGDHTSSRVTSLPPSFSSTLDGAR